MTILIAEALAIVDQKRDADIFLVQETPVPIVTMLTQPVAVIRQHKNDAVFQIPLEVQMGEQFFDVGIRLNHTIVIAVDNRLTVFVAYPGSS